MYMCSGWCWVSDVAQYTWHEYAWLLFLYIKSPWWFLPVKSVKRIKADLMKLSNSVVDFLKSLKIASAKVGAEPLFVTQLCRGGTAALSPHSKKDLDFIPCLRNRPICILGGKKNPSQSSRDFRCCLFVMRWPCNCISHLPGPSGGDIFVFIAMRLNPAL